MSQTTTAPTIEERIEAAKKGMTLALHARHAPDRLAIASPHGDRTFGELNANANRLVRALRARGLGQGDSIALACANRPAFPEVTGACLRMGVRVTPVNWHLTGEEMAYIVENCEAKAFIADTRFAAAAGDAAARVPGVAVRLAIAGDIEGFDRYEDVIAAESGDDIDDPIIGKSMLYTSGTTGRPKGVDRPPVEPAQPGQRNMAGAIGLAARHNPDTDAHLCTGPLYHAAPLAFSLNGPLTAGVGVILMDGWDAEEALRLIDKYKATHTHMVPTMFHRLLAVPDEVKQQYDVSSMRFIIHGAAPCPVHVKQALMDWLGPIVYEYYAATEGGGTFVTPEEWLAKPGTVGKPADPELVQIQDDDGNPLGANEIGTVYLRAPEGAKFRYYKDDEKTSKSYRGNYFTLGDHGYVDDDGWLFLTGRTAEVIISGGVNIYPTEVDAVLLTHPAVGDAGTIGIPNEEWGEEVKAVVELKKGQQGSDALAAELMQWCKDRLAHFKCPRTVDFVDELPRHDNGKLYRQKLRQMYVKEDPR